MIDPIPDPRFLCDSMLGGLSRKLRLAGYDAAFAGPIDDPSLVARAASSREILLSSDAPLFDRRVFRDGTVHGVFVPRVKPVEQARFVLCTLGLPVREPRCLACGGVVLDIDKEAVRGRVPEYSYSCFDEFYVCSRCDRVLWRGSHWESIAKIHEELARSVVESSRPAGSDESP